MNAKIRFSQLRQMISLYIYVTFKRKNMFATYLELGFEHILDWDGYDHIIFVVALCAIFSLKEWKRMLVLVTAFTIGHSFTLALSALDLVSFDRSIIEFLIPVTILFTALMNVLRKEQTHQRIYIHYLAATFFGLIHGLGFSSYLKSILFKDQSVIQPLLAFNIGVELGQIVIVFVMMIMSFLIVQRLGTKQRSWTLFVSGAAAGISLILMNEAKFW